MTQPAPVVFLLDVDNTLLDNDRVVADLRRHLAQAFGPECQERYWTPAAQPAGQDFCCEMRVWTPNTPIFYVAPTQHVSCVVRLVPILSAQYPPY